MKLYDPFMKENPEEVVVLGLGFVGLTLSVHLALHEKKVLGIEINEETFRSIGSNRAHFYEKNLNESLEKVINNHFFEIHKTIPIRTSNVQRVFVITVGTPLIENEVSALAFESAVSSIISDLNPGDCIITRSTWV